MPAVLPYIWGLIGVWLGVFGYQLFRIAVLFFGGAAGASAAYTLTVGMGPQWLAVVLALAGAAAGVAICFFLILVPLFVFGFTVGFSLVKVVCTAVEVSTPQFWVAAGAAGGICGLFCVLFRKQCIIMGTGFVGAGLCTMTAFSLWGGHILIPGRDYILPAMFSGPESSGGLSPEVEPIYSVVWLTLFVVFVILQRRQEARRKKQKGSAISALSGDRFVDTANAENTKKEE